MGMQWHIETIKKNVRFVMDRLYCESVEDEILKKEFKIRDFFNDKEFNKKYIKIDNDLDLDTEETKKKLQELRKEYLLKYDITEEQIKQCLSEIFKMEDLRATEMERKEPFEINSKSCELNLIFYHLSKQKEPSILPWGEEYLLEIKDIDNIIDTIKKALNEERYHDKMKVLSPGFDDYNYYVHKWRSEEENNEILTRKLKHMLKCFEEYDWENKHIFISYG